MLEEYGDLFVVSFLASFRVIIVVNRSACSANVGMAYSAVSLGLKCAQGFGGSFMFFYLFQL